jgi:hypothetical protein
MKIAVFMSDNRPLNSNKETCQYNSLAAYINSIYCIAHKYDFYYLQPYVSGGSTESTDPDVYVCSDPNTNMKRHASWAKLLSALLLCRANNKYDYIVCIDSDCVFLNFQRRIESLIHEHPEKDLIIANNSPYHPHLPCCAFFICKNTEWMQVFLERWYTYKNPSSDSNEWKHVLHLARKTYETPLFSIDTYWEQDTMWLLFQDPEIASHIQLMSETIMYDENADQYLIHISHERNEIRKPYLIGYTEYLEKKTGHKYKEIIDLIPLIVYNTSSFVFNGHSQ